MGVTVLEHVVCAGPVGGACKHGLLVLICTMYNIIPLVPVNITQSTQPVHQCLTSNQPLTLFLSFTGRIAHNLTVTWFHDAKPLSASDPRITTTLNSDISNSTLVFTLVRRADAGLYRVLVSHGVSGLHQQGPEITFQLDITGAYLRVDLLVEVWV